MKHKLPALVKYVIVFAFPAFILISCVKDHFNLNKLTSSEWNPAFAVPLIHSKLGVYNILAHTDSNYINIDQSGMIALVYKGELFSFEPDSLIDIQDLSETTSMALDASESTQLTMSGAVTVPHNVSYPFPAKTAVTIDSILLKGGTLDLNLSSGYRHSGSFTISIPSLRKGSQVFQVTLPLNYTGSTPVIGSQQINMNGYSLVLPIGGNVSIDYTLTLNNSGQPVSPGDELTIEIGLKNLKFSRVYGDFGDQAIKLDKDSINLALFNSSKSGYFALVNPKVKINIHNSFGIPIAIETQFDSYSQATGQKTPIILSNFPNPFLINHPQIHQLGSSVVSSFTIDKSNSNVDSLITPTPKYFIFEMGGKINPNGSPVAPNTNFITDESRVKIDVELELPLEGFAHGITFMDTLDFEFGENMDEVDEVLFRVNLENGFPIDLRMELVFLDQFKKPLDTMLSINDNLIASGIVGPAGKVISPTTKITDIKYNRVRMEKLSRAKYVVAKAQTNTYNASSSNPSNPIVKLYDDYTFNLRVGMKVQGKVKF